MFSFSDEVDGSFLLHTVVSLVICLCFSLILWIFLYILGQFIGFWLRLWRFIFNVGDDDLFCSFLLLIIVFRFLRLVKLHIREALDHGVKAFAIIVLSCSRIYIVDHNFDIFISNSLGSLASTRSSNGRFKNWLTRARINYHRGRLASLPLKLADRLLRLAQHLKRVHEALSLGVNLLYLQSYSKLRTIQQLAQADLRNFELGSESF